MGNGSVSGSDSDSDSGSNGWSKARGVVLKTLVLIGGALLLKRLTKSTTRWDHTRIVADSLAGEKVNLYLSTAFLKTQVVGFGFFFLSVVCFNFELVVFEGASFEGAGQLFQFEVFFVVLPRGICPKLLWKLCHWIEIDYRIVILLFAVIF